MNVNILMEIIFNIAYLIVIYLIVIKMSVKYKAGIAIKKETAGLFITAFLLLAIGDTGHVGFRVVAYLLGGLVENSMLIGAGAFSTALTVTVFYMLMAELLRRYTEKPRNPVYWMIMIIGIARLVFMLFPGNQWGGTAPLSYSYIRNASLTIMGLTIAAQYLKNGIKLNDSTLKLIAAFIFVSYGFYIPVILFVHLFPSIGVLMIPKTCAYVAIAIIGNRRLFER